MGRGRGAEGAGAGLGRAGGARKRPVRAQTVWILTADKKLQAAQIRTGISDGRFTQVVDGAVKPGDEVVVGMATSRVEGPAAFGGAAGPGGRPGGGGGGQRR